LTWSVEQLHNRYTNRIRAPSISRFCEMGGKSRMPGYISYTHRIRAPIHFALLRNGWESKMPGYISYAHRIRAPSISRFCEMGGKARCPGTSVIPIASVPHPFRALAKWVGKQDAREHQLCPSHPCPIHFALLRNGWEKQDAWVHQSWNQLRASGPRLPLADRTSERHSFPTHGPWPYCEDAGCCSIN
jgi:hypothetical protein